MRSRTPGTAPANRRPEPREQPHAGRAGRFPAERADQSHDRRPRRRRLVERIERQVDRQRHRVHRRTRVDPAHLGRETRSQRHDVRIAAQEHPFCAEHRAAAEPVVERTVPHGGKVDRVQVEDVDHRPVGVVEAEPAGPCLFQVEHVEAAGQLGLEVATEIIAEQVRYRPAPGRELRAQAPPQGRRIEPQVVLGRGKERGHLRGLVGLSADREGGHAVPAPGQAAHQDVRPARRREPERQRRVGQHHDDARHLRDSSAISSVLIQPETRQHVNSFPRSACASDRVAGTTCCPGRGATRGGVTCEPRPLAAAPPGQQVVPATPTCSPRSGFVVMHGEEPWERVSALRLFRRFTAMAACPTRAGPRVQPRRGSGRRWRRRPFWGGTAGSQNY